MCDQCRALQAENRRLQAEIKRLKRLVKLAAKIIKQQRIQLNDIQLYATQVIAEARRKMAKHLPRGQWAFEKGRLEVAGNVFNLARIRVDAAFWQLWGSISGL